eukprot:scpid52165/ scgid21994/ 
MCKVCLHPGCRIKTMGPYCKLCVRFKANIAEVAQLLPGQLLLVTGVRTQKSNAGQLVLRADRHDAMPRTAAHPRPQCNQCLLALTKRKREIPNNRRRALNKQYQRLFFFDRWRFLH